MLDIKFIREHPDVVRAAIQNKKTKVIDLDEVVKLHEERKELRQKIDEVNGKRNEAAAARDVEGGKKLKEEHATLEEKRVRVEKKLVQLLLSIPNIPSPDTPVGEDEAANRVVKQVGEKRSFGAYSPQEHFEIGEKLGLIDSEKATKVSGARFVYLKGDLALLQYALFQLSLSILTDEEILKDITSRAGLSVSTKPFIPVVPPLFIRKPVQICMARFLTPEEHYIFPDDDLMLIGSAEHTLGPLHMNEIILETELPLRYVAYTPAFRREAGSYGKDTKGIIRMHQFDKMEMESFTKPEDGYAEQDFLVAIQEHLLSLLGLPYQVVVISTGDMGFPDQRQIDMEVWMPGQSVYRETHSADYTGGFQARRLNTRVKRADGEVEPLHMNDATMVAMGRTLAAILENYQEPDGTVRIPKALQPYMGKDIIK